MFRNVVIAPDDPIFSLNRLFHADSRPNKINLGIGIYKDEAGKTPILSSVKEAERFLLKNETTKSYLDISGISTFSYCTQELLFGKDSAVIANKRVCTTQTPGGTAALRVAADFLAKNMIAKKIWISAPSWPNYKCIFNSAGLSVNEYTYYDTFNHTLNFNSLLESLNKAKSGDVVLLHGCCHNPTGIDPTLEQWKHLAELFAKKKWLPLFDIAYQGFANNLEEDVEGLRVFAETHNNLIVVSSYSKNFSLYNERVGACTFVTKDSQTTERVFSQIKSVIRANYSNPPAHGAYIIVTILRNSALRALWEQELADMRQRIRHMRQTFVNVLLEKGAGRNFSFIIKQNGMFSLSNLTKEQIFRLRKEFGIYITEFGRLNIAGITMNNILQLCKAIIAVL